MILSSTSVMLVTSVTSRAAIAQPRAQHGEHHVGTRVADVDQVVDGRPAAVDAGLARVARLERLLLLGQRVEQADHDGSPGFVVGSPAACPGEGRVQSPEGLVAGQGGEHEVQLRAVLGAGEGDAQRHEEVARGEAALLAPGAIGGEQIAGVCGRQPLRRRRARRSRNAASCGRRARGGAAAARAAAAGGSQHGGRESRRLTVGDERRLERGRQGGGRLGRRARPAAARRSRRSCTSRSERHDVLVVEPVELGLVEDARARRQLLELELGDHAVPVEDLVLAVRPAEQRQVVDDRLRQVAEVAELADRGGAVALGELAAVRAQHQRVMREVRRRGTERAEQQQLAGRVGQVVVAADDVRDAHVAVVDDRGEVVAGDAVRAHDDEVADRVLPDDDRYRG